jgi:hypothetical protein
MKTLLKHYMNMKLGLLNETKHENQKVFHDVHLGALSTPEATSGLVIVIQILFLPVTRSGTVRS